MKNKILFWAVFLFSLSAFVLPIINPDIFWHLLTGKIIAAQKAVPRADVFSWSMNGREWLDFEWLSQAVYFLIWKYAGFRGLFVLKFALLSLALFVSHRTAGLSGRKGPALILLPLAAASLVTNSDLRPENFSLLFFALLMLFLERKRTEKSAAGFGGIFVFIAFFALWANIHAGHFYGSAVIFLYFCGEIFTELLPRIYGQTCRIDFSRSFEYLKLFFASLAGAVLNPYGVKIFNVALNHQKYLAVLQEYIQEWKPFDIFGAYQWPFAALFFFSFLVVLFRFIRKKDVPYHHIFSLLFFAYYAVNYSRFTPFFVIVAYPASIQAASGFLKIKRKRAALFLFFAAVLIYYAFLIWPKAGKTASFINSAPASVKFLEKNGKELSGLKMFNEWGWGGYLEFNLWPGYRTFMDGRYLFHSFLEETQNCWLNYESWSAFLKKYDFSLLVLERGIQKIAIKHKLKNGEEKILWRPAYLVYLPRKEWALVHWDSRLLVFARRDSVPEKWLGEREYRYFRADDTRNVALMVLRGELSLADVRREVNRFMRQNPPCLDPVYYAALNWLKELENAKGKN